MNRKISMIVLSSLLIALFASCGSSENIGEETADGIATAAVTETTEETVGYIYPDVDYEGYDFRILNFNEYMGFHVTLDFDEMTGEGLNDALYLRNRLVEEKLNFVFDEIQYSYIAWGDQTKMIDTVRKAVMTGDNSYDAAYLNLGFDPTIISEGALLDLNSIGTLNLDAEWWDHTINDTIEIKGKLYGASSPIHLLSSEHAWCLLFNQDMTTDLGLELPYDLVREGKWTIDKMQEYVAVATNLNGDESFAWKDDGNAVYGLTAHPSSSPRSFVYSAGNQDICYENGAYTLSIGDEHYYNTIERLSALFNKTDGYSHCNADASGSPKSYDMVFRNNRALFISAQLFMCIHQREMDATFGLLPNPKYDEAQESYRTLVDGNTALLCIPSIAQDTDRIGVILDALSYESMTSVIPVFFESTVSYKGLRNEESIEMLALIRQSRGFDLAWMYQLNTDITSAISKIIVDGSGNAASTVAAKRGAAEEKVASIFENFGN